MNWYLKVLNEYSNFNGRARRQEYWMFTLFNTIFSIVANVLDMSLGLNTIGSGGNGPIGLVYSLAVLIPGLAVAVRRLHDTGKSGWNLLWMLLPIAGWIYIIVLLVRDSDPGVNEYGENPKVVVE